MIAKISAGAVAACLLSSPVLAGPYANVESNSGFAGFLVKLVLVSM